MEGEQRGGEDRGAFATGLAWGRVAASADWLPLAAASSLCLSRASASCCLRASAFCCSRASALTRVLKTVCRSRASASADCRPLRSSGRLALTRPKDSPFALPAMGIQFCSVASACQEEMHAIATVGAARACGGRHSEMRRKERRGNTVQRSEALGNQLQLNPSPPTQRPCCLRTNQQRRHT